MRLSNRSGILLSLPLLLLALAACGLILLDDQDDPEAQAEGRTVAIQGQVVKGPVSGGTVKAYALDPATGAKTGAAMASASTGSDGRFTIRVGVLHRGPLLLEADSGSFRDEATGVRGFLSPSFPLSLALEAKEAGGVVMVTPLTHLAASLARSEAAERGLVAAIRNAHARVAELFGLADPVFQAPTVLEGQGTFALDEGTRYGLVLAGLSQLAQDNYAGVSSSANGLDLARALAEDLEDGKLDARDSAGQVPQAAGVALSADAALGELEKAMDNFAQNTFPSMNQGSALPVGLDGATLNQALRALPVAPAVASIVPKQVTAGAVGTPVTIKGSGFLAASGTGASAIPIQVLIGVSPATDVQLVSATELTCKIPPGLLAARYDVTVLNPPSALGHRLAGVLRATATSGSGFEVLPSGKAPAVPAAPKDLDAQPISETEVVLTWTDASSDETGFRVERKLDASGASYATVAGNLPAGTTTYTNTGLSADTAYVFRVFAKNNAGDSAASNEASAKTLAPPPPPPPPAAPTNLSATAVSDTQLDLAWTNNASDEDGFRIERKLASAAASAYAEVGRTGPDETSLSDLGLPASTEYAYRVFAYNALGGDSAASNEATRRTQDPPGTPPPPPDLPADTFTPTTGIAGFLGGSTAEARLPVPLRDFSATLLEDGDVLIAGGVAGGSVTDRAFLYHEATGEFEELSDRLNSARALHTATRVGDQVFIMGGVDSNGDPIAAVEEYDAVSREFNRLSDMPVKRAGHAAVPLSTGEVLVIGGAVERMVSPPVAGGIQTRGWRFTNTVDLFRRAPPVAGNFNTAMNSLGGDPADLQIPRAFFQACLLPKGPGGKDRVLVVSGLIQVSPLYPATGVSPNVEIYDLETNTWTTVAVPGLDKRWGGQALPVNERPDSWDVILYGGLEELFLGQEILSFLPGQSTREMGELPVITTEVLKIESNPSLQVGVIAEETVPRGLVPSLGAGLSLTWLPRLPANVVNKQHLQDRYLAAGGIGTFPPPTGTYMPDEGVLLSVDIDPLRYPAAFPSTPASGLITWAKAGSGDPIDPATSQNRYGSTNKLQSARVFHGAARLRGKDGLEGTPDDTVLLVGGKLDASTATETADLYGPPAGPLAPFVPPPPPDTAPPTFAGATNALQGTPATSSLVVNWSAASDDGSASSAITYKVYRSTSSGFAPSSSNLVQTQFPLTGVTSFSDTGLSSSFTYYYVVRAVDEAGNEDTNTARVSASTQTPAPAAISWTNDIVPIWSSGGCTGCHGTNGSVPFTLSGSADVAYAELTAELSSVCGVSSTRVVPSDPGSSAIVKKLEGTACGDQMPKGGQPLSTVTIQKLRDWITQGAYNDAGPSSEAEPNNLNSNARVVPSTLPATFKGTVSSVDSSTGLAGGDLDFYKFDVPGPGRLSVSLTMPSGADYDLAVFDNSNTRLATARRDNLASGVGTTEELVHEVGNAGTVYVQVAGYAGITGSDYTLSIDFAVGASTPTDPGPQSTATPLASGLSAGRSHHVMALLPGGKVLVAGGTGSAKSGTDAILNARNTTEIFTPGTPATAGTFAAGPNLSQARYGLSGTVLPDGRVLLAGGDVIGTADIYDPAGSGTMASAGSLPGGARLLHTATLLPDGRVLLAGGITVVVFPPSSSALGTSLIYDPKTAAFAAGPALRSPRHSDTATLLADGRVLLAGGMSDIMGAGLSTTEIVDVRFGASPSSVDGPPLTRVRDDLVAVRLTDGRVLVCGGQDTATGASLDTAELVDWNPGSSTLGPAFTALTAKLGGARSDSMNQVLPSGKVLIFGGERDPGGGTGDVLLDSMEVFNPSSQGFSSLPALAAVRDDAAFVRLLDGRFLITGGVDASDVSVTTAEVYELK